MTAGGKRTGCGRPKIENKLVTKSFRVNYEAYNKACLLYPKQLGRKLNAYIIRLVKNN